jgi:hypothetical protein
VVSAGGCGASAAAGALAGAFAVVPARRTVGTPRVADSLSSGGVIISPAPVVGSGHGGATGAGSTGDTAGSTGLPAGCAGPVVGSTGFAAAWAGISGGGGAASGTTDWPRGEGGRGLVVRLARGTGVTERGRTGSAGGGAGSLGEVTV